MRQTHLILPVIGFLLGLISAANAESTSLVAHLLGGTAHSASDAFAEAQFTYDSSSRALDYYVNYDGVAPSKMDIHGPAGAGENAPALVTLSLSESPISGTVTLTPEQAAELLAGKTYLDIHSKTYPDGEIRGQITK
jgi:CHRD domain